MQVRTVAIAGASCSGKTTLARALQAVTGASLVKVDDYYRPLDHLTYEERCEVNFDCPDALDLERMAEDVRGLRAGRAVESPRYDFTRHTRFPQGQRIPAAPVVIVEGLYVLARPDLRELFDLRVFVEAPDAVCLARRTVRDVEERGRTPEEVRDRFHGHVAPMARTHVLPTRSFADLLVAGDASLEVGLAALLDAFNRIPGRVPATF